MEQPVLYTEVNFSYQLVHRKNITHAQIPPHVHDSAEIYLTLSPLPNALLGNRIVNVLPGTLILIPPFCVHRLFDKTDELYDRYILSVNHSWLEGILSQEDFQYEYLKHTAQPMLLPLSASVLNTLQQNFEELLSFSKSSSFDALSCFFRCMAQIDRATRIQEIEKSGSVKGTTTQQTVSNIIRYLDHHCHTTVSLADLSKHFYLNPDYISRIFKQHTHSTISSYITLQKITRARQLLQEGYTVVQTQEMTGYSSYAHFSRTFKQQVGISPGAYRSRYIISRPNIIERG